jgi:hypothetical protein
MTTKENKLIQLFYPNVQWKLGQEDCLDRAERCVVIADEYAIDFYKWMRKNDTKEVYFHYTDRDMLNAFKEEKGL